MTDGGARFSYYLIMWVRVVFGVHSLLSGANYFLEFLPTPQVTHPVAGPFVNAMTAMGLFDVIKIVEVLVGISLLVNRGVVIALLAELPTSVSIFWMSVIVVHSERSIYTGAKELLLNLFLIAAYAGFYLPLLKWKAEPQPIWAVWRSVLPSSRSENAKGEMTP